MRPPELPMPMPHRRTLLLFRAGALVLAALLAAAGWLADRQLRVQQRDAALSELDAVASERKQQINGLLARFAAEVADGVPESSPERLAELASLVRPRHDTRPGGRSYLLDVDGHDVTGPDDTSDAVPDPGVAYAAMLAVCLSGEEGRRVTTDGDGDVRVVAYRVLPVHGLCLLVTSRLAEAPAAPRDGLVAILVATFAMLLVLTVMAERALRPAPALPRAPQITDKQAAIQKLLPGGISQEDFLGRVSHEVRTPLNGVLGTVGLLLKTPLDTHQRELAELARASGEDLLAAIDDILENPGQQGALVGTYDTPCFAGTRVLLVEDNTTNQIVARLMLVHLGCEVDVAGDGRDALRLLDATDYDVVLMDCEMPGLDGFATTANIRRRGDAKARLPIIALTAQAMAGDRERCLASGMDDYLSKPVTEAALAAALQRWLAPDVAPMEPASVTLPAPGYDEAPAVDPGVILRLRELANATDPTLLGQILEAFRCDGAQHIAAMEAAIAAGDRTALRAAAHVIKGASSTVGAAALTALAQQIYALPSEASLLTAQDLIRQTTREFVRALDEIARLEPLEEGAA